MDEESWLVSTISLELNDKVNSTATNYTLVFGDEIDLSAFFGNECYDFHLFYRKIHGYLSLAVCVFGIVANVLNIIVLTRKNMISATNAILTGMAVSDMLVIASYIPFAIHNFIRSETSAKVMYTYGWAIFTLFHAHFTVVCHTISIWLTVILAIWRYLAVSSPTNSKTWCSMDRAKCAILSAYLIVPVVCLPLFLSFTINHFHTEETTAEEPLYRVDFSDYAVRNDEFLQKLNFWVFSVCLKLIPCILLTILSLALIRVLLEANRRQQRLHSSSLPLKNNSFNNTFQKSETERHRNSSQQSSDRTTKMLIAVLIMFLVCEFPSGILALLSGLLGKVFFRNVYNNFGDLMDMLALINSAVNFVLYCLMSQQFRRTFSRLFCLKYDTDMRQLTALQAHSVNANTCINTNTTCV